MMKLALQDRLLRRELGGTDRYAAIKGLYGDRTWADDLDIVNELGGHSGCVNALRSVRACTKKWIYSNQCGCIMELTFLFQLV